VGFREKLILIGVVPWIVVILLVFFLVMPSIKGNFEKTNTLIEKELELETLEIQVNKAKDTEDIEKEIALLKVSLLGFNQEFPEEENLEVLYVDIQTAINKLNSLFDKLAVSKEKAVKFPKNFFDFMDPSSKKDKTKKKKKKKKKGGPPASLYKKTIKLNYVGEYQDIIDFLYYLDNYYRFIELENIAVKTIKAKEGTPESFVSPNPLSIVMTFGVYRYQENFEVEEDDEEKKDSKKSKKK
jgi:Tfp pilus assembly protein PilO